MSKISGMLYRIRWRRAEEPDTPLECRQLTPRVLVARLIGATKRGAVIVDAVLPDEAVSTAEPTTNND